MANTGWPAFLWKLKRAPIGVVVVFALAGFLASYVGTSDYATQLGKLYAFHQSYGFSDRSNLGHWIWLLDFPIAMTFAILLTLSLGWLPKVKAPQLPVGLFLLFIAGIIAALVIMLGYLGFLAPFMIAASAYFLELSRRALRGENTGGRRRRVGLIFFPLLISIPFGVLLGIALHGLFPTFLMLSGIKVMWGVVFGASLALPGD